MKIIFKKLLQNRSQSMIKCFESGENNMPLFFTTKRSKAMMRN